MSNPTHYVRGVTGDFSLHITSSFGSIPSDANYDAGLIGECMIKENRKADTIQTKGLYRGTRIVDGEVVKELMLGYTVKFVELNEMVARLVGQSDSGTVAGTAPNQLVPYVPFSRPQLIGFGRIRWWDPDGDRVNPRKIHKDFKCSVIVPGDIDWEADQVEIEAKILVLDIPGQRWIKKTW